MKSIIELQKHPDTGEVVPEIWLQVKNFEGHYDISNYGRVRSVRRWVTRGNDGYWQQEKFMAANLAGNKKYQYLTVSLRHRGNHFTCTIHRLVASHFIPNPDSFKEVNHKDRNKTNNFYLNLEWVSPRENSSHGPKSKSSKYTGVCWNKTDKVWKALIFIDGEQRRLGNFKKEEDAARAYIDALKKHGLINRYAVIP